MTFEEVKELGIIYHHKFVVLQQMNIIIQELIKRAQDHDNSKFSEEEFPFLVKAMDDLHKVQFGTPEYAEVREKWSGLFNSHYKKNSHHPEFYPNGIEDMNLLDLVELLCDWKAASMRKENGGTISNSIRVGTERYGLSSQLVKILENTARACKM
jgi:hypothetical protein